MAFNRNIDFIRASRDAFANSYAIVPRDNPYVRTETHIWTIDPWMRVDPNSNVETFHDGEETVVDYILFGKDAWADQPFFGGTKWSAMLAFHRRNDVTGTTYVLRKRWTNVANPSIDFFDWR
jgi:hypothetical protein